MTPYLRMSEIQDQPGPWIALNGFYTQEDEQRGRRIFCFIRSFLVARAESGSFFKHLSRQNLGGRWLPEIPEVIYTFAGEIPWCKTFPQNGLCEFCFVVKEEPLKVRRKKPAAFLDGKQIELTHFDLCRILGRPILFNEEQIGLSPEELDRIKVHNIIVEEEQIKRQTKKFNVLIPVREFGWERRSLENESIHSTTLAKEIAHQLQLVGQPQTFDLFTKQGVRATFGVSQRQDYSNAQHLLLMREDLLRYYLKMRKFVLVWAIWGEREYSTELAIGWQNNKRPETPYKVYQTIKRYDTKTRRVLG